MRAEKIAFGLSAVLVALHFFYPAVVQSISPWILGLGLIFPGIPHGAVDHWLRLKQPHLAKTGLTSFFVLYIMAMLVVVGIWWLSPLAGLSSFILYSAWHFGETDLRDWHSYQPKLAWIWGLGVLLTLLFTHFNEFESYLNVYEIGLGQQAQLWHYCGLALGLILLALGIFQANSSSFKPKSYTALTIALGAFLPLLLAFALYFVAGHSFRGWRHLQRETKGGFKALFIKSLPFSLLAFVFLAVGVGAAHYFNWLDKNYWPILFIFVASLSAPHVWLMHGFYRGKQM